MSGPEVAVCVWLLCGNLARGWGEGLFHLAAEFYRWEQLAVDRVAALAVPISRVRRSSR
jgi:hypothetical protein